MSITPEETTRILRVLNLPASSYAVCGGALLARLGIRDNVNDIDLLVLPPLLEQLSKLWLLKRGGSQGKITPIITIDGVNIEAFSSINFDDAGKVTAAKFIGRAIQVAGIPYVQLKDMLLWKVAMCVITPNLKEIEKHKRDVELMKLALEAKQATA